MKALFRLLTYGALAILAGCSFLTGSEEPQIVFGQSIRGIEVGDDSISVIQAFGVPVKTGIGDFNGYTLIFAVDGIDAVEVTIAQDSTGRSGVAGVTVFSPFPGTTREGVGIGSPRESALDAFGPPDDSDLTPQGRRDVYHFEASGFIIEYRYDVIYAISMVKHLAR